MNLTETVAEGTKRKTESRQYPQTKVFAARIAFPSTIWHRITNEQFYFYFVIVVKSIKRCRVGAPVAGPPEIPVGRKKESAEKGLTLANVGNARRVKKE